MARGEKRSKKTGKGSKGQNRAAGEAYLAKQRQKAEISETDSGLLYQIIEAGDERRPDLQAEVKLHYRVGLVNGKVFSDTYQRDEPRRYKLKEVIDGLAEGIQLIGIGGKIKLIIPPDLAWGSKGSGSEIGPDAVIIWTAELLDWH